MVALGTPAELKSEIGGDVILLEAPSPSRWPRHIAARFGLQPPSSTTRSAWKSRHGHRFVTDVVEAFPGEIEAVSVSKPSLEDVFIRRTGHRFWTEDAERSRRRAPPQEEGAMTRIWRTKTCALRDLATETRHYDRNPTARRPTVGASCPRFLAVVARDRALLPPAQPRGRRHRLAADLLAGNRLRLRHVVPHRRRAAAQHYLDYFFPGALIMIVLFTAIFTMMSVIEDRKEGFLLSVLVAPGAAAR